MERATSYKTRQSEAILSYIASLDGLHVTASQIAEVFKEKGTPIGVATIYRHLDKLVESGKVKKYVIDGASGACYQYISENTDCSEHFHLKCADCGKLVHLQCGYLDDMQQHILKQHEFDINTTKTVFYGKCKNCSDINR